MQIPEAGSEGEFIEGHELDGKTEKQVPKPMIGRRLSQDEAKRLLAKLRGPFLFTQPTTPTFSDTTQELGRNTRWQPTVTAPTIEMLAEHKIATCPLPLQ